MLQTTMTILTRALAATLLLQLALGCLPAAAEDGDAASRPRKVSPVRGIEGRRTSPTGEPAGDSEAQSFDGSGNNVLDPTMGAAGTPLLRRVPADYGDGFATLAGSERPGARAVSNGTNTQLAARTNEVHATDFLWQWGQFLDHDIDLTDGVDPPEPADIPVPAGDLWFDPSGSGTAMLSFNRSIYDSASGSQGSGPRQQLNQITGWIDGSNVYGSDAARSAALRTLDGTGRLKTSAGDLLPFNVDGLENAGGHGAELFLAGDVRANEQVGLTAMHTLFVREHNRHADAIRNGRPGLSGEEIFQRARRLVISELQIITEREFLPTLLGPSGLPPYRGYDPTVDASIANVFATAAYRFGHSALSPTLLRLDARGQEIAAGHLALRDAFFSPARISDEGGIAPVLRGLAAQECQAIDLYVIDDVRNFLFGAPGAGGFDLAALNVQRGRDHGLPSYNAVREAMGLGRLSSFVQITSDPEVQARLAETYGEIDAIDAWVGALAEDPLPGAMVGELVATIVREQFAALRDGDRYWYANVLGRRERDQVEGIRLSDVIRANTAIGAEIPDDVFHRGHPAGGRPRR
jgi:peroxidase